MKRKLNIKKVYECSFPLCNYTTTVKSRIHFHHIKPRELDSSPLNKVTIPLCPNCHAKIYVPEVKHGQHTVNSPDSLQILGIYKSNHGNAIHYKDYNGNCFFYLPETKEIVKDSN